MIFILTIFCIGNISSQNPCKKKYEKENYVPKNLNDALNYLECTWSESDKEEFKNKKERSAVAELHHGTGRAIRNSWGLWKKRKNSLSRYFKRYGIFHPDDISSIILTSFHRKLNNKKLDLEKQAKRYIDYWERLKN